MSRPDGSTRFPFMLRSKQSLTLSSIRSTLPLRGRYWGNRAYEPTQGIAFARKPPSRWQLAHRSPLPTWRGRLSRVASRIARPRIAEARYALSVNAASLGIRNGTRRFGSGAAGDCDTAGAGAPRANTAATVGNAERSRGSRNPPRGRARIA